MIGNHLQYIDTKHMVDRIYYNVTIRYEDNPSGESVARFQEDRVQPIVNKADDWYLTITRFNINARNIPIFIMDVIPNPGDATDSNYCTYSVTLIYYDLVGPNLVPSYYPVNLTYVPQNSLAVPAPPVALSSKNLSRYYYVYSYQHMLDMVNAAMLSSFTTLKLAHGAAIQSLSPFFKYEEDTQLISLITPYLYSETITGLLDGTVSTINRLQVSVNDKLYNKCFEGIPPVLKGRNRINGDDIVFYVSREIGNNNAYALPGDAIPASVNDPEWLEFRQEGVTLDQWNDFSDILFATQTLPTVKEMVKASDTDDGLPNFFATLTDYQPNLSTALSSSSILSYFQNGPYRLINLTTPIPLRTFDFTVYWVTKTGEKIPLYINWNDECSVKFAFLRRSSFTS